MTEEVIPGFQKLSDDISIFNPRTTTRASATAAASPSLIIYCSWTGAAPRHTAKYTQLYQQLFPEAEILLVQSRSAAMVGTDLGPALNVTKRHLANWKKRRDPSGRSGIILQLCSNGGASNATALAQGLRQSNLSLPLDAIILDCSPGKLSLSSGTRAASMQLPPNLIIREVGSRLIYIWLGLYILMKMALRSTDHVARIRQHLNDPMLFSQDAPRLYIYSKGDALIEWTHVREHCREAAALGYKVREEVFYQAPHCALLREDSGRYERAIQEIVRLGYNS